MSPNEEGPKPVSSDPTLDLRAGATLTGASEQSIVFEATGASAAGVPQPSTPIERGYTVIRHIGQGGLGMIILVMNTALQRHEALKVMLRMTADSVAMFRDEMKVLAELDHPNVVKIYSVDETTESFRELGIPAGKLFFTMQYVVGHTLAELMVAGGLSRERIVEIVIAAARGLGHAHRKGVVHRDVKPENIMVTKDGNVLVIDFGISRFEGIAGTPAYMAPEQKQGMVDWRVDVYALGLVLENVLAAVEPDEKIRKDLAEICAKAHATLPEDRFENMEDFIHALERYLEVEKRREEARTKVREALILRRRTDILDKGMKRLEVRKQKEESKTPSWRTLAEKSRLHAIDQCIERLLPERILLETRARQLLIEALAADPDNVQARSCLAMSDWSAFQQAEARSDTAEMENRRAEIQRLKVTAFSQALTGHGALTLTSVPEGATATLYELVPNAYGVNVPVPYDPARGRLGKPLLNPSILPEGFLLGSTPSIDVRLPMGDYLVVLQKEGFTPTRYPISITRQKHWRGSVELRKVGGGFIYVPAGEFPYGGDIPRSPGADDEVIIDLPGFEIGEHDITCGEYREYLNSELAAGVPLQVVCRRAPRGQNGMPYWDTEVSLPVRSETSKKMFFQELVEYLDDLFEAAPNVPLPRPLGEGGPAHRSLGVGGGEDKEGSRFTLAWPSGHRELPWEWDENQPVVGISQEDAIAYCEWRSRKEGVRYRLPMEREWEKASRGVSRRNRFPWGLKSEPQLANCSEADAPGTQHLRTVGSSIHDRSIYGVSGCAGGVCNWTADTPADAGGRKVYRGGAWNQGTALSTTCIRNAIFAHEVRPHVGFRVIRETKAE